MEQNKELYLNKGASRQQTKWNDMPGLDQTRSIPRLFSIFNPNWWKLEQPVHELHWTRKFEEDKKLRKLIVAKLRSAN